MQGCAVHAHGRARRIALAVTELERLQNLTAEANRTGNAALVPELRRLGRRTATLDTADAPSIRGGAFLLAFKLGFDQVDLDRAIDELAAACDGHADAIARGNLAAALLERSDLSGSADDYRDALELLRQALEEPALPPTSRLLRRTTLLSATLDGIEREFVTQSARQAVADAEQLFADATAAAADTGEIANVAASAYFLLSNQEDVDVDDLSRMVDFAERAAAALETGHPDLPARLANLATMHLQVHHLTGDGEALSEAITAAQDAYRALTTLHPSRPLLINNLLNTAVAAYEAEGRVDLITELVDEAARLMDAFPDGHPLRPIALSNIGLFTRVAASALYRPDLIDISARSQREALLETPEASYRRAGREASLALALSDRFHRDADVADLTEAIELSEHALARAQRGHQIDVIGFETNLANMYHDRFTLTGDFTDLQQARDLHQRGVAKIPPSHPDRASLLNNAGGCFHASYLRLGDHGDLEMAVALLREAVQTTEGASPLLAARRINYAGALDSAAPHSPQTADLLAEAESQVREALAAELDTAQRETAVGILIAVLRSRYTLLGEHDVVAEMAAIDPPGNPSGRPVTSLRRGITAGLQGDEVTEACQLRAALAQGAERHPAAALSAASLLARRAVRAIAGNRHDSLASLDEAAAVATDVRDRVGNLTQTNDVELSWYRDLDGIGEAHAHGRLLCGDPTGAVAAIESTRAWFLGRRMSTAPNDASIPIVYLWTTEVGAGVVMDDGGSVQGVTIPDIEVAVLRDLAVAIRTAARRRREPVDEVAQAVAYLTAHLSGPLSSILAAHGSAAVSVAGPLASLPIAAIAVRGEETISDRCDLVFSPTRSMLSWAAQQAAIRPLDSASTISFADPQPPSGEPLPAARSESLYVAGGGSVRHGASATGTNFVDALKSADIVHAALHAASSSRSPLATRMFFADGPLHVDTVLRHGPYRARLAILSACETASRSDLATDQLIGFANALHASGVPAVLGSLWSVGDLDSAAFVAAFVDRLRAGASPPVASREAQRELRERGLPPSRWAAFELLGL